MKHEFIKEVPEPKGEVWHKLEEAFNQYKKSASEKEKEVLKKEIKKLASKVVSRAEAGDEDLIKEVERQLKELGIE